MDESNASRLTGRLLLTEENYFTWTTMMESKLDNIGVLDFILGENSGTADTKELYNRKSYNLIIRYLNEANLAFVSSTLDPLEKRNGKALWKLLKDKYMSNDIVSQTLAFAKFRKIEFKGTISFINDIRTAVSKMKLVGFKLEEKALITMILSKLPKELESLVRIVSRGNEYNSVDHVLKELERDHVQFEISDKNGKTEALFGKKTKNKYCNYCKGKNHTEEYCWKKYPEKMPKNLFSSGNIDYHYCNEPSHLEDEEAIAF